MGKILSVITKPVRDYNIESRAHKAIARNKPVPAPKYEADKIAYEKILNENPEALQISLKKNEELDKRLKDVFVMSSDDNPVIIKSTPDKPLPLDRMPVPYYEFGYKEPDEKSKVLGKISLKQALEFITDHQKDPKQYNIKFISDKYLITEESVDNILRYFKIYEIYIPSVKPNKFATFAGPSFPRNKVQVRKKIEALPKEKDEKPSHE